MIIIQLDNERLSEVVQNAVNKAITEPSKKPANNPNYKEKALKKHHKTLTHKKHKRFPKLVKLLKWLIQLFFVFVWHDMVKYSPKPALPPTTDTLAHVSLIIGHGETSEVFKTSEVF